MAAAAEVAAANEKWGEMMKEGNAKGLSDLYTEDCQVLPQGSPLVVGREAFQKLAEGFIAGGCKGAKLTTDLLDPTADSAPQGGTFWERGNYKFYKEGGAIMDEGKYVVIWKKVSPGDIQMYIDIWNSNSS